MANLLKKAPWASRDKRSSGSSGQTANDQDEGSGKQDEGKHGGFASGLMSKAPWASKEKGQDLQDSQEESLTTILSTREQRTEFLLLVAQCTEKMRSNFLATFDPDETSEQKTLDGETEVTSPTMAVGGTQERDKDANSPTDNSQEDSKEDMGNAGKDESDVKKTQIDNPEQQEKSAQAAADAKKKAKQEHEKRVKEVQSVEMQELRKSGLDDFDDWSQRVLGRVGEAVNQYDKAEEVKKEGVSTKAANPTSKPSRKQKSEDTAADTAIKHMYPPIETSFVNLEEAVRVLILHSMLLLMISLENYSSYSRVLLTYMASSLNVPIAYLAEDESRTAQGLLEAAKQQMNADEQTQKKADENVWNRRIKVGLGTVAGAALIGVTGGLAAPLLAAGVGTVMGGLGLGATATATYLGAMAGSAPLVGALFGAYGGRMAGQMVDNYAKEINDFAFIPVHRPSTSFVKGSQHHSAPSDRRLRVTIGISGWLNDASDVVKPWQILSHTGIEAFALRFELEALIKLGNALTTYIKSAAWGVGTKAIVSQTFFATLSAGLWPLGIVKAARVVDNPFSVARSRSEKAGRVLADALINRVQGERPVTLIGYSLGARAIFYCLDELSRRKAFGLVESIVLAGAAVPADSAVWRRVRSVVTGRVVNVFSTNDYLLGFLYRTASLQFGVAGLQAIHGVANVENIDVSESVNGHTTYRFLTGTILSKIGFEDVDEDAVFQQQMQLNQEQKKQDEERKEAEAKQQDKDTDDADVDAMEKEVEKKNEKSFMGKMTERMGAMTTSVGEKFKNRNRSQTPEKELSEEEKFRRAQEKELRESVEGKDDQSKTSANMVGGAVASASPMT
ncbi:MAG: hypothetical protein Q9159_000287 [Coniocarpon cinnabarinum]